LNVASLKTVGVFALLGAVIGHALATLIAPGVLTWYNTPGASSGQAICDTQKMSHDIFSQLIRAQLIGAAVGAAVFVVLGILFVRYRSRRFVPTSPATP
jgi:hypothetical protein